MQNERISFDAMPEMLAAIAQKLESIRVTILFPITKGGRALLSESPRLTNGYNKATERARRILCWRPVNSSTERRANNNLS